MKNVYTYVLQEIPQSLNHYLSRFNVGEYRYDKARFERDVFYLVNYVAKNKPKNPLKKAIVQYTYNFKTKIRRDPDNYNGKMLNDALVKAGVLEDDTFNNIIIKSFATFGNEKESTVIEILEVDELDYRIEV